MNTREAFDELKKSLLTIYDEGEADAIASWTIESVTGLRNGWNEHEMEENQLALLKRYENELLRHRPVQYVLGESYFGNLKLFVDESVLIPRPETEELVMWVTEIAKKSEQSTIIDIGTGSGCIALSLKQNLPTAAVSAVDFSVKALDVARKNAATYNLDIDFVQTDFLQQELRERLPMFDLIVSNPPYIGLDEQADMESHVLDYEPHAALFVTDNDPLQFYKAIEDFGQRKLNKGGYIFCELNSLYAAATEVYFEEKGWTVTLKKDMQGKDRMLMAQR